MRRILTLTTLALAITGCRAGYELSDEGTSDGAEGAGSYAGPISGAHLILDFDSDDGFEIQKRSTPSTGAATYTIEGTFSTLSSGFTRLTITEEETSSVSTDFINALRVSDQLTFLYPFETTGSDIIAMIVAEDCPSSTVTSNYVGYDFNGTDPSSDESDIFGTLEYNTTSNVFELTNIYSTDDDFTKQEDSPTSLVTSECADGVIDIASNPFYLADNDTAIFTTTNNGAVNIGLEEQSFSRLDSTDDVYIGFMSNPSGNPLYVRASCDDGTCAVNNLSSASSTGEGTELYTLELENINSPESGFIEGTISTTDNSNVDGAIICNFNDNIDDVKFLACVGQSPENNENVVNLFISSKPGDDSEEETTVEETDGGDTGGSDTAGDDTGGSDTSGDDTTGGDTGSGDTAGI